MTKSEHLTKLAIMVHGYGGTVQMESSPGIWIKIHNPLFMEGKNFRPFEVEPLHKVK